MRRFLAGGLLLVCVTSCASPPAPTVGPEPSAHTASATPAPAVRSLSLRYTDVVVEDTPVWELGAEGAVPVELPVLGSFYGFDPDANRILYATHASIWGGQDPQRGGPDSLAVGDLAILDVGTGTSEELIPGDVVEALWAPNHADLAYILATPETYELRWRTSDGADRLLASDVTADWSISPNGEAVAFTRESNASVSDDPGLFVVRVAEGTETEVADIDAGPSGSVYDQPVWSPDNEWVLFSYDAAKSEAPSGEPQVIVAAVDGSGSRSLTMVPASTDEARSAVMFADFLWAPDGTHIVAAPWSLDEAGDSNPLVTYAIDPLRGVLSSGRLVAEIGSIIGWDVPGESVWVWPFEGGAPESVDIT